MTENEVKEELRFENKLLIFENGRCFLLFNQLNEDLHGMTWDAYGSDKQSLFHWKDKWLK